MSTIWVREFKGGLDARRLPEATGGGVLIRAQDCHINRGGEVEKRAAFVLEYTLPTGIRGLAGPPTGLTVFGSATTPSGMPSDVAYQRLEHPSAATLRNVLSKTLYAGKIYAVGEYNNGDILHFYDGSRVTDWVDGRARASFTVTGGTSSPLSELSDLQVDGVPIIASAVTWDTDASTTAADIVTAINGHTSTPDYTAVRAGATVTIVAADVGTAANDKEVAFTTADGLTLDGTTDLVMAGGAAVGAGAQATGTFDVTAAPLVGELMSITIDDVEITGGATVGGTGDVATTAALIAARINTHNSTPEYTAAAVGATVTITATDTGTAVNGQDIVIVVDDGLEVGNVTTMHGGVDETMQPGTFVRTIGSRVHTVSGSVEYGSGIKSPTAWNTDTVGAYAIDMSTEAQGSETLTAIAEYQNFVAIFAERAVQIWQIGSDPANNAKQQVLANTGTSSPRSVTPFGDADLLYLDETGVRSLRARDSSNAAATSDIGVPVDPLIVAKLRSLSSNARTLKVMGVIEPLDGRFWLIMRDEIYVFSYFPGSKISAWSVYTPQYVDSNGDMVSFAIDDATVFQNRVYLRSNNLIFCYGGINTGQDTDATEAEAWIPYLDGERPAVPKMWSGFDAAVTGTWEVSAAMRPDDLTVSEKIATIHRTTYNNENIPMLGESTHMSLRFKSKGSGRAVLSSCAIHYKGDDEDAT